MRTSILISGAAAVLFAAVESRDAYACGGCVAPPTSSWTQNDWLHAHGLDRLVDEGRAIWADLGSAGGLEAIAAQSRIVEAEALVDPAGLGGFTVLDWTA